MPKPLVNAVREALRETGLSLRQLEECTGVSRASWSRFLRGECGITLETLARLTDGDPPVLRITVKARRHRSRAGG